MRLKYKKLILIFTVAIMFIGLLMFSIVTPTMFFSSDDGGGKQGATSSAVKSMTEAEIKDGITNVVKEYMDAKQKVDMDAIAKCVIGSDYIDEKQLVTDAQFVEEYRNIKCTIKDSPDISIYRVYVYQELKVYNIDTLIPAMNALYVTATADGSFKVYFGDLESETKKAIDKIDNSSEIQKLKESVNKQLEDLASSNEDVRSFQEMLDSSDDNEVNDNIDKEGGNTKQK